MPQAIVFDFDGVLVDSEPLHFAAIRDVAAGIGVAIDQALYDEAFIGFDDRDAFRAALSMRRGGTPEPVDVADAELRPLCEAKQRRFEALIERGVEPLPGVRELLDEVDGALPIAIGSGATRRDIDAVLGRLGWAERFPVIVTADDVARSKPDPATYALAVRRLGERVGRPLSPGSCLAIEDTRAGLASAAAAGLRTLGVATTGPAESLREAERVEPSLAGVTLERLQRWFGE